MKIPKPIKNCDYGGANQSFSFEFSFSRHFAAGHSSPRWLTSKVSPLIGSLPKSSSLIGPWIRQQNTSKTKQPKAAAFQPPLPEPAQSATPSQEAGQQCALQLLVSFLGLWTAWCIAVGRNPARNTGFSRVSGHPTRTKPCPTDRRRFEVSLEPFFVPLGGSEPKLWPCKVCQFFGK